MDEQKMSMQLWRDLKTDEERAKWLLMGRGYETGVIAHAIQNDVAMAYHRLAQYATPATSAPSGEALRHGLDRLRQCLQMNAISIDTIHEHGPQSDVDAAWQIMHDDILPVLRRAPASAPLDDGEVARLRRVVRALGIEQNVPQDDETLRGCLFTVLGMIARKLEQPPASTTDGEACAHCGRVPGDRCDECENCPDHSAAPASAQQGEWDGDDFDALRHLSANFIDTAGVIQPKPGYSPTSKDYAAIDYLCNEWDYAYATTPKADAQQGEGEPPLPEAAGRVNHDFPARYVPYWTEGVVRQYGDARAAHAVAQLAHQVGDGVRTDLSVRLRETADQHPGWRSLLTQAADEIERYYGGMLNWKRTAEAKDAALARAATTVPASESIVTPEFVWLAEFWSEKAHCGLGPMRERRKERWDALIAHINAWHAAGVEKARAVPEGFVLVPGQPTEEMMDAFAEVWFEKVRCIDCHDMTDAYAAMLAAAPSPAAAKEGGVA